MMLDKYQCELLDVVLEAFGSRDSLSRNELLDLFALDEAMAAAMVSILAADGWITSVGPVENEALPLMINRESRTVLFLKNGGYTRKYEQAISERQANKELDTLQKANLALQNESLNYQKTLRERDEQIKDLDIRNKRLEFLKYLYWLAGLVMSGLGWWIAELIRHAHSLK